MDIIISIIAVVAGIMGIVGSFVPALPGPPLSWLGMLVLYFWGTGTGSSGEPMSLKVLLIYLAVTVVVSVLDYIVPSFFTKLTGGSKYAERGAMAGLLLGIIFTPVGMILGSFLGAFLSELYYNGKGAAQALKAAAGSFLGFIMGTGLKTIASCMMLWQIVIYLI